MLRFVIVEDKPAVSDIVCNIAKYLGHEIVGNYKLPSVFDAKEGWKDVDIVLMDNRFGSYANPLEVGSDYLRETFIDPEKRTERASDTAFCLMSGDFHIGLGDVRELNSIGIHYLAKPFTVQEFKRMVDDAENKRQPLWSPRSIKTG